MILMFVLRSARGNFFLLSRKFIISYEVKTSLKVNFTIFSFFRQSQMTDIKTWSCARWVMINALKDVCFYGHQHIIDSRVQFYHFGKSDF